MVCYRRFRPILATCAALLAASHPQPVAAKRPRRHERSALAHAEDDADAAALSAAAHPPAAAAARDPSREIAVVNSDAYAESVVALRAPTRPSLGISEPDHAKIAAILATTREIVHTAGVLAESGSTQQEVKDMLELANSVFGEVKDHIHQVNVMLREEEGSDNNNSQMDLLKTMLRKKFSGHDLQQAREDDERSLDVTRDLYSTMINFPECVERLFKHCLAIINRELASLGLTTIEVIVYEKRTPTDEGYQNVVIITNMLADRVLGRAGDGIVTYPYIWNDAQMGPRTVGVDGKWNCLSFTPEDCCRVIKEGVPNPDVRGRSFGCHIFVPFGGAGNAKRNDRVIVVKSQDGRVQEAPIIQ